MPEPGIIKPGVIKLGGSLCGSPLLHDCLTAISEHGKGRAVVVPGGGPFADAVRLAQKQAGYDDATAHHMALLAMEQFAHMLANLNADFIAAKSLADIQAILKSNRVPLWLPTEMALAAKDIPASWDMTSDSLAAWLATQIGATTLFLVKSCDVADREFNLEKLVQQKIVDPLLPRFVNEGNLSVKILSADAWPNLAYGLLKGSANEYL